MIYFFIIVVIAALVFVVVVVIIFAFLTTFEMVVVFCNCCYLNFLLLLRLLQLLLWLELLFLNFIIVVANVVVVVVAVSIINGIFTTSAKQWHLPLYTFGVLPSPPTYIPAAVLDSPQYLCSTLRAEMKLSSKRMLTMFIAVAVIFTPVVPATHVVGAQLNAPHFVFFFCCLLTLVFVFVVCSYTHSLLLNVALCSSVYKYNIRWHR